MKKIVVAIFLLNIILLSPLLYAESNKLWSEVSLAQRSTGKILFELMPERYSLYQLDETAMRQHLNKTSRSNETTNTLSIPLPSGELIKLIVTETSVMAAELAAKYPELKTYKASVVDRPSVQGVVDMNELGFHGMLFMENGQRLFIDPRQSAAGKTYYISYYDSDYHPKNKKKSQCNVNESSRAEQRSFIQSALTSKRGTTLARTGANLRTYRLAMAVTGEYTQFYGGIKSRALSAITTTVSRVNQVYERDLAIRLMLVANNDQIIFTPDTNPYSDNTDDTLLEENQFVIDRTIGVANYDIGHVMTKTNEEKGAGVAIPYSVCNHTIKVAAMTGHPNPQNDPFDIDYVAHELGHQFGAMHSFNAKECNRNEATAWEIGNGVTIMGYAGVCAPENDVQSNSIALFHIGNIREMSEFIDDSSGGASCGTVSSLNNQQPMANAGSNYTIPAETPFQLTGTGTDLDTSDTLSYTWEQMDLGTIANINDGDLGDNPLFRAFLPTNINSRIFPQLSDILNNTQTRGEILPTTSRNLKFAFTVRDQKGGIADDEVNLTIIKTSKPFKITSHTTTNTLTAGSSVNIHWDVAETNIAPINCHAVDISLSIDGGQTFATVLAQNSPNDGSETITIPDTIATNSSSRLKIACSNNIFFDISDANLSITNAGNTNIAVTQFNEGNSNHVNYFKLAISTPLAVDASVSFETRDGTAKANEDYLPTSGKATIPAGKTEKLIGVTILGDNTSELDETFSLVITEPINGVFPQNRSEITATHTILNDD